jgi:hypothetical protein
MSNPLIHAFFLGRATAEMLSSSSVFSNFPIESWNVLKLRKTVLLKAGVE